MENKNMENSIMEKKAMAFEVSNIVNNLNPMDARTIYLIAQVLEMKKQQRELEEQSEQDKS